ncbi:dihydrodipicolinate synthase family protein [Pseudonocardia benzenivorans]|uniref:Dihydrodipicolinate synthase family protein n=1 Tax=Pseudonocardia benzenivorans TaxID=228005 RepID=A0ABW3VH25_9PSEU
MTRVTVEDVEGVFAIMPTPATPDATDPACMNSVDHEESARAAAALVDDGVHALMVNGTFGEGATLTWDEHRAFARTVIDAVAGRVPVFVGATTLNTRDTITRASTFADLGASGLLLGRPMWSPCDDATTLGFYRDVAAAVPDLGIVVYDNPVAFDGKLSPRVYAGLSEIPQVIAAKYPTLGPSFLADLEATGGRLRILPVERDWYWAWRWAPDSITGCWSGSASCGPHTSVVLAERIATGDDAAARRIAEELRECGRTFFPQGSFELFSRYNVQLEKIRIDEAGYLRAGPCRPPYVDCPPEYAEGAAESGRRLAALSARYAAERAATASGSRA